MSQLFTYPIHPIADQLMKQTEDNSFPDPFFSMYEKSVVSLLIYYFESLFEPFNSEQTALETLQRNPAVFQFSLDVFQKSFMELPEESKAKQVFAQTSLASLTPGWEDSDRKIFMSALAGLRRRLNISKHVVGAEFENYYLPKE